MGVKHKINSIQVLRGVAAMLVVLLHCVTGLHDEGFNFSLYHFYNFKYFGAIGVDIFFVVSGFIISQTAKNNTGKEGALKFLKHRFLRINPVYYLYTIPMLLWMIYKHSFSLDALINSLLIIPFFTKNTSPVLYVGWTLAYEYLFYCLYAILVLFFPKRKTVYCFFLLLFLGSLGIILSPQQPQLKLITNPLLIEFSLGLLVGMIWDKQESISIVKATFIFSCAIIAMICLFIWGDIIFNNFINVSSLSDIRHVFFVSTTCFLLVLGSLLVEKSGGLKLIFNGRLLLILGNASYSVYLIHWYSVIVLIKILYHYFPNSNADYFILGIFGIAISVGLLMYKYIEKPLLSRLSIFR